MPESISSRVNKLKEETKGPVWQFAGVGIFILLFIIGAFASSQSSQNTAAYLASPMAGDVYEYKFDQGSYSTFLVARVVGDSVFVHPNEYEINKITRLYRIEKPENYSTEVIGFSRADLEAMRTAGDILNIKR
ncbi:hypothetical protein [Neolewinella lacunae]|nr:hypothetical protein [Neolewinella lacunae]